MTRGIIIAADHSVQKGTVSPLHISIDGQNGVDTLEFIVPENMADWAWRVDIEQGGERGYVLLGDDLAWTVRAGEVTEGEAILQVVASKAGGAETLVWKSREFLARVLPAINAAEAVTPGETSALDVIAAQVKSDADRADAAALRAEDAAAGAENIVNTVINDIEAEGQKQAAAVASSGTQALEAIGQAEQIAIAQVQASGTTQVGAVEDAGDSKLAEINAANAHAPQINEETGKWQVWDAQAWAYVDTGTDAQGPQGETGATGLQGPAGADGIGLPMATAEDAGKVPVVGADGSYTLSEPVPEVDATLTEAGAPADAAAVGEAIEAISPDDAAVDGKPWTSRHIVDMLCPPLEASGNPVVCHPIAGYPLSVVANWQPAQEGEGDPSPENVRPISGRQSVTIVHNDASTTLALSEAIYGGNTDVATGEGTKTWDAAVLCGYDDGFWYGILEANSNDSTCLFGISTIKNQSVGVAPLCTHLKRGNILPAYSTTEGFQQNPAGNMFYIRLLRSRCQNLDEFKEFLAAQYEEGNPVTIVYCLETPQPFAATGGQQINALAGVNTVITDGDSVSVTGRADPVATVQALTDRVAALEQAAVNSINNTTEG